MSSAVMIVNLNKHCDVDDGIWSFSPYFEVPSVTFISFPQLIKQDAGLMKCSVKGEMIMG